MKQLKTALATLALPQAVLARELKMSPAAINQLINHAIWPRRTPASQLIKKIEDFLRNKGLPEEAIATVFEGAVPSAANTSAPRVSDYDDTSEEVMLLRKQGLTQAAKKHFGLFNDPFMDDVQSPEDVFQTPDTRYMLQAFYHCAKTGGFLAGVSESGGGKTTLRRALIDRIRREKLPIIVIEPHVLGLEDNDIKGKTLKASHIAEAILSAIAPLDGVKRSAEARMQQVHKALLNSSRAGFSHVLIIEEAHGLPIPTLKHLKRFFELEDGFQKLLSIILIGQSELKLKLSETNYEVREVVQRCEIVELEPLGEHLPAYLKFKFDRINKPLNEIIDVSGVEALSAKLTRSRGRRDRHETVSMLYPLAVNNAMVAAMNFAAEIGVPFINADVIQGV